MPQKNHIMDHISRIILLVEPHISPPPLAPRGQGGIDPWARGGMNPEREEGIRPPCWDGGSAPTFGLPGTVAWFLRLLWCWKLSHWKCSRAICPHSTTPESLTRGGRLRKRAELDVTAAEALRRHCRIQLHGFGDTRAEALGEGRRGAYHGRGERGLHAAFGRAAAKGK